jgi:hypothetical protein
VHEYTNHVSVGLRGCIIRLHEFMDDFGNTVSVLSLSHSSVWCHSYYLHFTNYTTGIGKEDIYCV